MTDRVMQGMHALECPVFVIHSLKDDMTDPDGSKHLVQVAKVGVTRQVQGSGPRAKGSGFRAQGSGLRAQGSGLTSGLKAQGSRLWALVLNQGSGLRD